MQAKVILTDEVKRDIEGIKNVVISTRIYELVERLKKWPSVSGCKPLRGALAGHYRMRTGDYRLQFRVEAKKVKVEEKKIVKDKTVIEIIEVRQDWVIIEKAGHRDGFYD